MCSVFHGRKGKAFAEDLARILGCFVAGHTYKVGNYHPFRWFWHSGLRVHHPDWEPPKWSASEGKQGSGIAWSHRRAPRTITFAHNRIPQQWLKERE
jgi:hypothetical protein